MFILGNDDAESDERNAKRSSDDDWSYLTEDTKKKKELVIRRIQGKE